MQNEVEYSIAIFDAPLGAPTATTLDETDEVADSRAAEGEERKSRLPIISPCAFQTLNEGKGGRKEGGGALAGNVERFCVHAGVVLLLSFFSHCLRHCQKMAGDGGTVVVLVTSIIVVVLAILCILHRAFRCRVRCCNPYAYQVRVARYGTCECRHLS